MIDIIIVGHFEIAKGFLHCVENILAKKIANLHILAVKYNDDAETVLHNTKKFINKLGENHEVLILADIFGATPSNIVNKLVIKNKIELLTGLSLPMLLRAISYANTNLNTCVTKAIDGAHNGIKHINGENND